LLQAAAHDVRNEILLQPHVGIRVVPGDFGFHHPELRQVPARLRLFGAERRTEAVDLAKRRRGGLDVQLAGLREIRLPEIEVVHGEQRARMLADRAGENGRVHEREVALMKKIANRLDDFVAHARDRDLLLGAQPQMPVLEQVGDPMLLRRDRKVVRVADDLEALHIDLISARCPLIGSGRAGDDDRCLLGQVVGRFEELVADGSL